MTGHYQSIDDSHYEVFQDTVLEGKKKVPALMARCTKSKTRTNQPFPIAEANILKMINFGTWKKIEIDEKDKISNYG